MTKDFEELFACLRHRKVKALVVGGYAVAFHGQPRFTKDIDVFVEPTPENADRLLAALSDFGFGGLGLTASDFASPGVSGHYGGEVVDYIGRAELIRNKQASARPQDLLDIEGLS
jgi:hypothetical protein